jgi:phosphoserine phosphatase
MADSPASTTAPDGVLQSILATTRRLNAIREPERLPPAIVEAARSLLSVSAARLWLYEGDSGELVLEAPGSTPPRRLTPGPGLLQALNAGTVLVAALADAVDQSARTCPADPEPGQGAALCIPLPGHAGGLLGVLELHDSRLAAFDAHAMLLAQTLAAQCAATLQLAMLDAPIRHARHLHAEAETARGIQRSTLPARMPQIPGYDLHGHFQPATYAGGDLFDIALLQHGLFLLLGDATGHGFGPALSATQMQGMLRVAFRLGADLDRAFLHVNNQLAEDLPDDRFVTAIMGFLDPQAHTVDFHSAGQPILHFRAADDRCEWLAPSTFPVGVLHMEQAVAGSRLLLAPGDILALISDGVYEQPGPGTADFGQQRVSELLRRDHALAMSDVSDNLLKAVDGFAAGTPQADDITILLVRRLP